MASLTARQKMIYNYIDSCLQDQGCAPTINEIRQFFSLRSSATVHKHLDALERRGAIRRQRGLARSLELIPLSQEGGKPVALPVIKDLGCTNWDDCQRMWVGEWMVPDNGAEHILFAPQAGFVGESSVLHLISVDKSPPSTTAQMVALILDNHTSMVRLARWDKQVEIYPDGSEHPGFSVNHDRAHYFGRVVNQVHAWRAF